MGLSQMLRAAAMFVVLSGSALAQQSGWDNLGRALAESPNDAYMRGAIIAAEMQRNIEAGRAARNEILRAEVEASWRAGLAEMWMAGGLDAHESKRVARTYVFDFSKQLAISARVQREGWQTGIPAAWGAYRAYDYQLANELLVATRVAFDLEKRAQPQAQSNPPVE